jgi:hypothetical protein
MGTGHWAMVSQRGLGVSPMSDWRSRSVSEGFTPKGAMGIQISALLSGNMNLYHAAQSRGE